MRSGNFLFVLHAHLPWVLHHGYAPHGTDWLCEAVAECYIPIVNHLNELKNEKNQAKITMDISPVLCEQLEHKDFSKVFKEYCDEKIKWAEKDEKRFKELGYDPAQIYMAQYWREWYNDRKNNYLFNYGESVIGALKELQDDGILEIATCGATHGYLPLLPTDESVNLQIEAAVNNYEKHFQRSPRGIWLPECAYRPSYEWKSYLPIEPFHKPKLRPGIEQILAAHGLEYFFTDQNLTERTAPIGVFIDNQKEKFIPKDSPDYKAFPRNFEDLIYKPYIASSSEKVEYGTAAVFTRHRDISMQVWSGDIGYPAEPNYLDFHKKQFGSNLRYWRVTDSKADMMYKTLYHPDWTKDKIDLQANHFIHHIENALNYYHNNTGQIGTLCAPFDAELFGHWWFEGPDFIKSVLRGLSNSPWVDASTASEQLNRINPKETLRLPEGSWGVNNNHDVWFNKDNKWTWEAIYNSENRIREIISENDTGNLSEARERTLKQALRELTLMEASDWQFLIHARTAEDYAQQRLYFHHSDFNKLCDLFEKRDDKDNFKENEIKYLEQVEQRNSIFPEIEIECYRKII